MMREIDLFVMVDEGGDYVIAKDRDDLADAWENDIGSTPIGTRVLSVKLSVETADTELSAVVPTDSRKATLTVS